MSTIMGLNRPNINTQEVRAKEKSLEKSLYFLSDRSDKDKKWDEHRSNAERIEDIYSLNFKYQRYVERMSECSKWLIFSDNLYLDTGESKLKLKKVRFCHVRHCPVCSWRRSLRNTAQFFEKIPKIKQEFPTHRFVFLTLTVPNCDPKNLRAKIKEMNAGWKRLIELARWPADGWVRTVEVTRSKKGEAHPHFHALLMVPAGYFSHGYISRSAWLDMWRDCMRDQSITQVDIRAVKPKIEGQDLHAAVVETLKYSTKVTDAFQDPQWLYTMTDQLKGLRFIATGGVLKDIMKDEETTDQSLINIKEDEIKSELIQEQGTINFTWRTSVKKYAKKGP